MSDERIAVLETRVDSNDNRIGGIESSMSEMGDKINEIHSVVVANKTNMNWVKKLTLIILGLSLGSVSLYGWSNIRQEAVAKKPAVVKVDEK